MAQFLQVCGAEAAFTSGALYSVTFVLHFLDVPDSAFSIVHKRFFAGLLCSSEVRMPCRVSGSNCSMHLSRNCLSVL